MSHDTNRGNKFESVGRSLIVCLSVNMSKVFCDLIIREEHHIDQRLSFNAANPYSIRITQCPYSNVRMVYFTAQNFFFLICIHLARV